jgi:hypothetical protein
MFLIRVTFWLALIVLLLPTDKGTQQRLYTAASETAHRVATFCDRNAQACARGSEYWAVFKQKLDFGAKLAYEIASERLMGKSTPAAAPVTTSPAADPVSTSAMPPAKVERAKGTLSPADLKPEWRGKAATKSGA